MKILLLSAYHADSHQRWCDGMIKAMPEHQWTLLDLPPRYFSWRVRGNSLSWAFSERQHLERSYDLVIATSMVDLSALRGFVPALGQIPTLVYFHENQFAYPVTDNAHPSVEPQILNLYTALCADVVAFNSNYNRRTFLQGVEELLRRLPDKLPLGLVERLRQRSRVLPVPLEDDLFVAAKGKEPAVEHKQGEELWPFDSAERPLRLLWAARWEYDKGPDLLLLTLRQLREREIPFQLCLMGQKFRTIPREFETIEKQFSHELVQYGYETSGARYRRWLRSADVVLSTARHEFQGLAVLEAIAAGCLPVLPDTLAYPELVDSHYLYGVAGDLASQASAAMERIQALAEEGSAPDVCRFAWANQRRPYRQLFEELVS
ncbi:DUF3524 domain-containing protein [Pseudomaricurvus alkylphenolicus]|uniref:tRNA-queuosine alpha-mannosyltransferase domain-containing protein n=1 Tax=Pseudomaricurvus alkylphenolicus TaxID=1306991 RepID=UPI001421AC39|nr:DUF3524 domain-containing protein [Pseudomaricurvus alkylphenolicus]NIB43288.1 DUF3524 domain-containing protein [Pseudomaricurvus alkylphenolicus]